MTTTSHDDEDDREETVGWQAMMLIRTVVTMVLVTASCSYYLVRCSVLMSIGLCAISRMW